MSEGKFYWLKLKRDFFKRHDIFIIEGMENGMEITHFYIKLMLESVDHNGELRFNEEIPYTPEMFASITRMNIESVNRSISILKSFGLLELKEDGTYVLPKVASMIDSASDSDGARRMRRLREQNVQSCEQNVQESEQNVTDVRTKRDENKSKSKSKSIEIDKRDSIKRKTFSKPTLEEISAYCQERNNSVDAQRFFDYYEAKGWVVGKSPMKDWKAAVRTWERNESEPKLQNPTPKKYGIDPDYFLQKAREEDARSGRS